MCRSQSSMAAGAVSTGRVFDRLPVDAAEVLADPESHIIRIARITTRVRQWARRASTSGNLGNVLSLACHPPATFTASSAACRHVAQR